MNPFYYKNDSDGIYVAVHLDLLFVIFDWHIIRQKRKETSNNLWGISFDFMNKPKFKDVPK